MSCNWNVWLPILTAFSLVGCSTGPKGIARDPVSKVTGTVLVDGKPEAMIAIRLVSVHQRDDEAGTSKNLTPSAFTDPAGKFSIGTYENGPNADGAPYGEYVLVFQWGQINLMGGQYSGDKFKGKYADSKTSEFKVAVAGEPIDLGEIQLTTK